MDSMFTITEIASVITALGVLIGVIGGAIHFWRVPDRLETVEQEVKTLSDRFSHIEGRVEGQVDMIAARLSPPSDPD